MSVPRTATVNSEHAAYPLRACFVPAPSKPATCAQSAYYAQTGPESCINNRFRAYIYGVFRSFPAVSMLLEKWRVSRMANFLSFCHLLIDLDDTVRKPLSLCRWLWLGIYMKESCRPTGYKGEAGAELVPFSSQVYAAIFRRGSCVSCSSFCYLCGKEQTLKRQRYETYL